MREDDKDERNKGNVVPFPVRETRKARDDADAVLERAAALLKNYPESRFEFEGLIIVDGKYSIIEAVKTAFEFADTKAGYPYRTLLRSIANNEGLIAKYIENVSRRYRDYCFLRAIESKRHPLIYEYWWNTSPDEMLDRSRQNYALQYKPKSTNYFGFGALHPEDELARLERTVSGAEREKLEGEIIQHITGDALTPLPRENYFSLKEGIIWKVATILKTEGFRLLEGKRKIDVRKSGVKYREEKQVDSLLGLQIKNNAHHKGDFKPDAKTPTTSFIGLISDDADFAPFLHDARSETFFLDALSMRSAGHDPEIAKATGLAWNERTTTEKMVNYLRKRQVQPPSEVPAKFALMAEALQDVDSVGGTRK